MNLSIVTHDITDVLEKVHYRISEHSWTLSCKNRIFKLEIKWQDSRAILTNVNTKPPTPHHSAKPTYFDAEPIGLNVGRVDPPTSRLPTIKIKRKSPSKIRRDKARLELWKSRRKTGQTTSPLTSTTQPRPTGHSSVNIDYLVSQTTQSVLDKPTYCDTDTSVDGSLVLDCIPEQSAVTSTNLTSVPDPSHSSENSPQNSVNSEDFDKFTCQCLHPFTCAHTIPVPSAVPISVSNPSQPLRPPEPIPTFSDWNEIIKHQPPPSLLPVLTFEAISPPVHKRHIDSNSKSPNTPSTSDNPVRKRHKTEITDSGEGACQRYFDRWTAGLKSTAKVTTKASVKPVAKRAFKF